MSLDPRRWRNRIVGWTIYALGDLVAQIITGDIELRRMVVLAFAGGMIYRFEVPWWFEELDSFEAGPLWRERFRFFFNDDGSLNALGRTLGSMLYFNPLWIARHMLFIRLAVDPQSVAHFGRTLAEVLALGAKSFIVNLPISLIGTYNVQMHVPLSWRFVAGSGLSAVLAIAYALGYRFL